MLQPKTKKRKTKTKHRSNLTIRQRDGLDVVKTCNRSISPIVLKHISLHHFRRTQIGGKSLHPFQLISNWGMCSFLGGLFRYLRTRNAQRIYPFVHFRIDEFGVGFLRQSRTRSTNSSALSINLLGFRAELFTLTTTI